MKSIIICEGSTDFVLLQYYMRKSYGWQDVPGRGTSGQKFHIIRSLKKERNLLNIGGCGGCSRIIPCFDYVLEINKLSADSEAYDNIVIVTDRDEVGTEQEFIDKSRF